MSGRKHASWNFSEERESLSVGIKKKCLVEETEYNLDMIKTVRFKDGN